MNIRRTWCCTGRRRLIDVIRTPKRVIDATSGRLKRARVTPNPLSSGLERRRLLAVLPAVALDVGTKRWQTLILA